MHFLHIANSDKPVKFFSLDVIISVGYRVKSVRGTQFRQWANKILKEYLSSKLKPVKFIENEDLLLLEIIDNEWNFVREEENTKGIIYFKDSDISIIQMNNILDTLNDMKVTEIELKEIFRELKWN